MSKEQVYDDEIAPLLLKAAKIAQEHEIPFLAVAEWEPGKIGRTQAGGLGGVEMVLTIAAAHADGNIDSLVMGMARRAKTVGHNSVVLAMLEQDRP